MPAQRQPVIDLFEETCELLSTLERQGIEYAAVGALALAVHGAPRATTDIDLLIRGESLAAVLNEAEALGFGHEALPMRFPDGMEVHRVSKIAEGDSLNLDLILVNFNLEEVWASRKRLKTSFGGIWVISRDALIQMKTLAGREQDIADIRRLEDLDR